MQVQRREENSNNEIEKSFVFDRLMFSLNELRVITRHKIVPNKNQVGNLQWCF